MSEEVDAYHEAGHVLMAYRLGCRIDSVTIVPDRDDGPARHGDSQIAWEMAKLSQREFSEKTILVALAGPVAEMIHLQERMPVSRTPEWSHDWNLAMQAASFIGSDPAQCRAYLEQVIEHLFDFFDKALTWAALGALVDNLLAHEMLDGEQVNEILADWI